MTDTSKYSNASLSIETMELLKKQSKTICSAPLSITKTIEHCAKFYEQYRDYIQYQIDKGNLKNIPVNKLAIVFCHEDDKVIVDAVAIKCAGKQLYCIALDKPSMYNNFVHTDVSPLTDDEIVRRNKAIYNHRVFSDNPKTLQELGTMFNISRERVRQIQEAETSKENNNANSN
jgi:hypothetical protein